MIHINLLFSEAALPIKLPISWSPAGVRRFAGFCPTEVCKAWTALVRRHSSQRRSRAGTGRSPSRAYPAQLHDKKSTKPRKPGAFLRRDPFRSQGVAGSCAIRRGSLVPLQFTCGAINGVIKLGGLASAQRVGREGMADATIGFVRHRGQQKVQAGQASRD